MMILRIRSDQDRRSCLIVLTAEAASHVSEMMAELGRLEDKAFGNLGKENIDRMIELNSRLTDSFMVTMQEDDDE